MHIFSTLFTAGYVIDKLRDKTNVGCAIDWCRASRVTRVYIEVYRSGRFADTALLNELKLSFEAAGLDVRGCVTTTGLGKVSTGWDVVSCYSAPETLCELQTVFERAAEVFDTVMIDDFLFTDCACDECEKARGAESWAKHRSETMLNAALNRIIRPSKAVNPNVKLIIKYPNWYEDYAERGYDTLNETKEFDLIWAGNETREPDSADWGRYPQYLAFYIQTYLNEVGGGKCGGGWYDCLGTKPKTYVEQARQTILGRADESMLFCYDILTQDELGLADTQALRGELPGLLKLDGLLEGYSLFGIEAPRMQNAVVDGNERNFYPFCGMLGIPVIGKTTLNEGAASAVLGVQAALFPDIVPYISSMLEKGSPLLLSSGLMECISESLPPCELKSAWVSRVKNASGVRFVNESTAILYTPSDLWELLKLPAEKLDKTRNMLLKPLGIEFCTPSNVSLHLYESPGGILAAIENFADTPAKIKFSIKGKSDCAGLSLPDFVMPEIKTTDVLYETTLPPRSLILV